MEWQPPAHPAGFRYGAVFVVTVALVVFVVAAPSGPASRAVAVGLQSLALTIAAATSRERVELGRARSIVVAVVGTTLVVLVASDALSGDVTFALAGLLAGAVPAALVGGLARLIRLHGVTLQAVLGALTLYLYVGLLFAWAIAFVSSVDATPYFAQPDVGDGDRVYFSFTTLTTTGFGDYTPATSVGHALAVVEMLIGQLYLVTVVGVLVANLVGRRR